MCCIPTMLDLLSSMLLMRVQTSTLAQIPNKDSPNKGHPFNGRLPSILNAHYVMIWQKRLHGPSILQHVCYVIFMNGCYRNIYTFVVSTF